MIDAQKMVEELECYIHGDGDCEKCLHEGGQKYVISEKCFGRLKAVAMEMANAVRDMEPATPMMVQDYPDQFGNRRTMYICGACKRSIVDGARFCIECGRQVRL